MEILEKLLPVLTLLLGWLLGLCTLYLSEGVVQCAKACRLRRRYRDEIEQLERGMRKHRQAFVIETYGRKHVRMGDDPKHSMDFSGGKYLECLYYLEKRGSVEMIGIAEGGGGVYILRDSEQYSAHKKLQAKNISENVS